MMDSMSPGDATSEADEREACVEPSLEGRQLGRCPWECRTASARGGVRGRGSSRSGRSGAHLLLLVLQAHAQVVLCLPLVRPDLIPSQQCAPALALHVHVGLAHAHVRGRAKFPSLVTMSCRHRGGKLRRKSTQVHAKPNFPGLSLGNLGSKGQKLCSKRS